MDRGRVNLGSWGLFSLLLLALICGCSARRVLREPGYGIVAIPYNSNAWPSRLRDQADELMHEHFPQGYQIVKEEEYVVGQTTHYDHESQDAAVEVIDDFLSIGTTQGRTTETTTPKTEYRIHYVPLQPVAGPQTVVPPGGYSPR